MKKLLLIALLAWLGVAMASESAIEQGKSLAFDRGKGNCLACHRIEDGELAGNLGPPLLSMKLRFPDREDLKRQICDATIRNENTRMPPFCRHGILTEEDVDFIIDYLYTL